MNSIQTCEIVGRNTGRDAYGDLSEDNKTLIAFGMTALDVVEQMEKSFRNACAANLERELGPGMNLEKLAASVKPGVVNAFNRGFILGLMDGAKAANQMIA